MKSTKLYLLWSAIICISVLTSCVSRKDVVYFENIKQIELSEDENFKSLKLKPQDLITINVAASEQSAAMPFNLPVVGMASSSEAGGLVIGGRQQMQTYRINRNGEIDFPVLGNVAVKGMTPQELEVNLKNAITEYVQDPIVNVRLVNFQISVLGEVNRPGTFTINQEKISVTQALGLAGDMSIYGVRNNVLVMREQGVEKVHAYLDLTDANSINSPFFYLQQNDVVYVEPNGAQMQGASYNRNAGVYISIASVLISLIVLITK